MVGNEKGGSGKTTTAMHVAAALLNEGFRVGTMDLDVRQRSFSRYIENRKIWVGRRAVAMPEHFPLEEFSYNDLALRQRAEQEQFVAAMTHLRAGNDFIVVDSPGSASYLSRLGHAAADTLITPINESFVDFDLLATVDPDDLSITGPSIYSEMVWSCRKAQPHQPYSRQEQTARGNGTGPAGAALRVPAGCGAFRAGNLQGNVSGRYHAA